MSIIGTLGRWFGFGGTALRQGKGTQTTAPSSTLIEGTTAISADAALQLSTVWACISILSGTISTLPLLVYESRNGNKKLARDSTLWQLMHESPNAVMTPCEFWKSILLNLLLKGNAYARIERDSKGKAFSLWPLAADQTEVRVLDDGTIVYLYRTGGDMQVIDSSNIFHLKEMGNGTVGLSRLDYMKATTAEAKNAQTASNKVFTTGGKPTGVLMIDHVLGKEQRKALEEKFAEMAVSNTSRLHVLEADMKYQQINMTPEDLELLVTRRFGVEELSRWFGVPAALLNHANVTAWGKGIESLIDGFFKFTIRPALVNIEQAITKRILNSEQRAHLKVEFNFEGLLRGSTKDRIEFYAKAAQNGIKTRNEIRQLENDPPLPGGDDLTVQLNLTPIQKLGQSTKKGGSSGTQDTIAQ